jgi:hypothetical protein
MAFTILDGGSFTSTGAGVKIKLPASADYFVTTNTSAMASTAAACVRGEWYGPKYGVGASAANDGLRWRKNSSHAILIDTFATSTASDGFTYVTTSPVVEAQSSSPITLITAASPAVISQTNTYSDGDILQIYDTTEMLQIAGMAFQISSVSGAGYTFAGLRAAGFATPATAGYTRRVSKMAAVEPQYLYVTEVTKASQAVVRCSVDPTAYYVVGMKVRFSVPGSFGMYQLDGLTGTITALSSANYTMTVDINSTAFSTFAFPASTSSPTARLFATVAPAGAATKVDPVTGAQTGYDFAYQPFRTGQFTPYMYLGGGTNSPAGAAGNIIDWMSYKLES